MKLSPWPQPSAPELEKPYTAGMAALLAALCLCANAEPSREAFKATDPASRPWVYWYFMEGSMTQEGLKADLAAMRKAGIGGAIMLEVNIGIPVGPVKYMGPEWLKLVGGAIKEAKRQGISISLGTGPGWTGAGGPWVQPRDSMQLLVSGSVEVEGPVAFSAELPRPKPREPFFGMGTLTPELKKQWESFYEDEAVVAVPADEGRTPLKDLEEKALYYRAPYSSSTVSPRLTPESREGTGISQVIELTKSLDNGRLTWRVPPGKWTIYRFGRTLAGNTTRPAPNAGLGFETDKFESRGIDAHLDHYFGAILDQAKGSVGGSAGLTNLHFDSWEMSSQNWSPGFREIFRKRRGYDPVPWLPVMAGRIVKSVELSERFLWDLRQTAQELVKENQVERMLQYGKKHGLLLDVEPYDMNPTSDLTMGAVADVPMGEFWSRGYGYSTEYSVDEAVSIAHTNGQPVVGAEAFTADDSEAWRQHPASMKAQTDWALATGINRIVFHRYQHQPDPNAFPGMTMGPYGVHWEATQPWWDMVPAYHSYLNRCQQLLKQGRPVADILYLVPEGAPNVFQAPSDARIGELLDRREYNYDGCSPETLIDRASVKNGLIVFPKGPEYRVLILPRVPSMTPKLMEKLKLLTDQGATIIGRLPNSSPSLESFPECDEKIKKLAETVKDKWIPDPGSPKLKGDLEGASWIWSKGGDAMKAAPMTTQEFRKEFTVRGGAVRSAIITATADNRFKLLINGAPALEGTDFRRIQVRDASSMLKPGVNTLTISASNDGDSPNPAGAIAKLTIEYQDGQVQTLSTDFSWPEVQTLGGWRSGPWGLVDGSFPQEEIYPSYDFVAQLLRQSRPPEIESAGELRYSHRSLPGGELFFVGNRSREEFTGSVTFRAMGQPEWWDPMTGETRPLPQFTPLKRTTSLPLYLPGNGSGFIFFRKGPHMPTSGVNFAKLLPALTLDGDWQIRFESPLPAPKPRNQAHLEDWSKSEDSGLKFFSGKGIYTTTFGGSQFDAIDLGTVKNAASVRINGTSLGSAWCAPFRLAIPKGVLKRSGNVLEVTIGNLWINRLIGDSALPAEKRIAQTTWNPFKPGSPLQASGLLGPVQLLKKVDRD